MVELLNDIARNDSEIATSPTARTTGPSAGTTRLVRSAAQPADQLPRLPVHHAIECFGQVGGVYNMMFNRDDMIHSAVNFQAAACPSS